MDYSVCFTPFFKSQLKKLKKKNPVLFQRLGKKIKQLKHNPEHYKPLRNVLKGTRAAHLDPFVIVFDIKADVITIHYVKHHNRAY